MSKPIQDYFKASNVQTRPKYTQTKLHQGRSSIKDTVEVKMAANKHGKSDNKTGHKVVNDCTHLDIAAVKKDAVPDIPPIVTAPEIRRVLCLEGVTKISIDLETSSRGKFDLNLSHAHNEILGYEI